MAIKLIANYSKRLGLPGYSSHQFSVSVETELVTTADIPAASANLYQVLQSNVDEQIQTTGFVPPHDYGFDAVPPLAGSTSHQAQAPASNGATRPKPPAWRCSAKQRDFILKIVEEQHLDKNEVENLSQQRFSKSVKDLNKIEASGLIDELLVSQGVQNGASSNGTGSKPNAYQQVRRVRS